MATISNISNYPLDYTGKLSSNLVPNDIYNLDVYQFPIVAIREGIYFENSLIITNMTTGKEMVKGTDYVPDFLDGDASVETGKTCYACVRFLDKDTAPNKVTMSYQVVGGRYIDRVYTLLNAIRNIQEDKRATYWKDIKNKPTTFPPSDHTHPLSQVTNFTTLINAIYNNNEITQNCIQAMEARLNNMIRILDENNEYDHDIILALYNDLETWMADTIPRLKTSIATVQTNVDAINARKINGYTFDKDIILSANDVDSVSKTKGGTFEVGFIDVVTNYGRKTPISTVDILNKTTLDALVPGTMLPVGKVSTLSLLPCELNMGGCLYKLPSAGSSVTAGYCIVFVCNNGDLWNGYSPNGTTINWVKLASQEDVSLASIGEVSIWLGAKCPDNSLFLKGGSYTKEKYPKLYSVLGTLNLTDMRGYVPRGWDDGRGIDSDSERLLLSVQDDAIINFTGKFKVWKYWAGDSGLFQPTGESAGFSQSKDGGGDNTTWMKFDPSTVTKTATETRMKNIAVNFIIRAK